MTRAKSTRVERVQTFECILGAKGVTAMSVQKTCNYCGNLKDKPGWHDCRQAKEGRAKIGRALVAVDSMMRGGPAYDETEEEAKRRSAMVTGIRMMGGKVKGDK